LSGPVGDDNVNHLLTIIVNLRTTHITFAQESSMRRIPLAARTRHGVAEKLVGSLLVASLLVALLLVGS